MLFSESAEEKLHSFILNFTGVLNPFTLNENSMKAITMSPEIYHFVEVRRVAVPFF